MAATAPRSSYIGATTTSDTIGGAPASHPFTCNSCQVAFRSSDAQRGHMRTDWHRYNLKRRVASLPPISSEVFAEKVISAQASNSAAAAKATFEKFCEPCQKTYYSENAFLNHLGSQKHKIKEAILRKAGTRDETGSIISGAFSLGEPINGSAGEGVQRNGTSLEQPSLEDGVREVTLIDRTKSNPPSQPEERSGLGSEKLTAENYPLLHCLFCVYKSPSLKLNIHHMGKYHGMFIPEQEYLVDLEGLIKYFYAKITENNECLYCHKIKQSPTAVQTHMRDKGHCMIAFETEDEMLEVGQFYDFSSTYSDEEDESMDDQEGGTAVEGNGDEDGWETDSSTSSVDTAEIGSVPIGDHSHQYAKLSRHKHHSHDDPRPHRSADGFHSHAHHHSRAAFYSDYELHLPSGRTAGHRSLARYFRQNLRNYAITPEERLERQRAIEAGSANGSEGSGEANTNRAVISRAKGGIGMLGATDSQKREVRGAHARGRDREHRARQRYEWGVEKRSNNQKHFRDPLLQ